MTLYALDSHSLETNTNWTLQIAYGAWARSGNFLSRLLEIDVDFTRGSNGVFDHSSMTLDIPWFETDGTGFSAHEHLRTSDTFTFESYGTSPAQEMGA